MKIKEILRYTGNYSTNIQPAIDKFGGQKIADWFIEDIKNIVNSTRYDITYLIPDLFGVERSELITHKDAFGYSLCSDYFSSFMLRYGMNNKRVGALYLHKEACVVGFSGGTLKHLEPHFFSIIFDNFINDETRCEWIKNTMIFNEAEESAMTLSHKVILLATFISFMSSGHNYGEGICFAPNYIVINDKIRIDYKGLLV